MQNSTKLCDHCGAVCDINDTYCKKCSHTFSKDSINSPVIDGIDNAELKQFLGKNSDYYLKKFAKTKNKKTFLQLNIPALLFGPNWFFYRKMYKFAILYVMIMYTLTATFSIAIPSLFKTDVETFRSTYHEYTEYVNNDGEIIDFGEGPNGFNELNPTYKKLSDDVNKASTKIILINLIMNILLLCFNVFFRLLSNSFYKRHIKATIKTNSGGTSVGAVVGGMVFIFAIELIISLPLLQIPIVSQFQDALSAAPYILIW